MISSDLDGATLISLVLASLLVIGAVSELALWMVLPPDGDDHATLIRVALLLVTIVGLISVVASVAEGDRYDWRVLLGTLRGMALLAVWSLVIYDVVRLVDDRSRRTR